MINNLDKKVKDEIQPVADVAMSDAFETSEKMRKLTRKELAELRAKRKEQMKQLQIKPEDQRGLIDAPLNESKEQLKEFYVLSDGVNPRHSEVFIETEEGKESAINAAKSREGHWEVIHTFFKENEKSPTQEVIFVKEDEEKKEESLKEEVDEKLLESTFRGVEGTEFIWHGEWSDPEIEYKDEIFNYWDVEDSLWTDFKDAIEHGEIKADEDDEEAFNKFCQEHAPAMLDDWIYAKEHKDESLKEGNISYKQVLKKLAGKKITKENADDYAKKLGVSTSKLFDILDDLVNDMYISGNNETMKYIIPLEAYKEIKESLTESKEELRNALEMEISWCKSALDNPKGRQAMDAKANYGKNWISKVKEDLKKFEKRLSELDDAKDESLKEDKQLKETWAGEDVIDDIVERAQANLKDGEDESDAIFHAIDEGLIYTKDIYTLVEHYGSIDTITMIESFYDDLYNDVVSRLDLSEEEIEELGEKLKQHHKEKKQLKEAISDKVNNYWSEVIEDYINRVEDLTADERIVKASQQDINDLCTRVAEEIMNDNSLWKEIDDAIEWHIYHDDFMLNKKLKEEVEDDVRVKLEDKHEEEESEEVEEKEEEEVEIKEEQPEEDASKESEEEKKEEIKGLGLERAKKLAKLINENELILSMIEEEEIEPEETEIKLETEDREEKFKFNDDDSVDVFIKKDNAEYDEEKDELVDVVIEKHFDTFKEWLEDELTKDDAFLIYVSLNKIDNESEDAEEESEEVKRFVADFDALDEFDDIEDDFKEGDIILDTEEVKVVESNNRNTSYVNVKKVNNTVNEDLDDCDNIEISQDQLDEMLKEANPQLVIKKPE